MVKITIAVVVEDYSSETMIELDAAVAATSVGPRNNDRLGSYIYRKKGYGKFRKTRLLTTRLYIKRAL